jgi:hypothetical protein
MKVRRFDRAELAFFAVPRCWKEIERRFGQEAKEEDFRNAIIFDDDEGGEGRLRYLYPAGLWVLTDAGKAHAGNRLIAREMRVYPDLRKKTAEPPKKEAKPEAGELRDAFAGFAAAPGPLERNAEIERLRREQEADDG